MVHAHARPLCYGVGMTVALPATIGPQFSKKVMPWVEVFWHNKKRYPLDSEFVQKFPAINLTALQHSKFWNQQLKARGIQRNPEANLSELQVAAISLITNFSDTRPTNAKLISIGVTPEQLDGWYCNPEFQRELAIRADSILDNIYPEAQAQLARQIKRGNFPALKFYYEITGRATSPESVNVKLAMSRLIEAVQKHVKDPLVLQMIANEINGVAAPVAVPEIVRSELVGN